MPSTSGSCNVDTLQVSETASAIMSRSYQRVLLEQPAARPVPRDSASQVVAVLRCRAQDRAQRALAMAAVDESHPGMGSRSISCVVLHVSKQATGAWAALPLSVVRMFSSEQRVWVRSRSLLGRHLLQCHPVLLLAAAVAAVLRRVLCTTIPLSRLLPRGLGDKRLTW